MSIEFHATTSSARNNFVQVRKVSGQKLGLRSGNGGGAWDTVLSDVDSSKSTGRWLFECEWWWFTSTPDSYWSMGLVEAGDLPVAGTWMGAAAQNATGLYMETGNIHRNGVAVKTGGSRIAEVATFSILYDADTRNIWFAKNGTLLYGSGDPVAGTNPHYTIPGTAAMEPAMCSYRYNSGQMLASSPSLPMLYSWDGYTPWGLTLHDVTIPALEPDKTFTLSPGTLATSRLIRYSIFAGTGILAAPIATGTFTTDGSALMPAVQIQTASAATAGWMVWHVDGSGPGFGGVRPVTLAVAA